MRHWRVRVRARHPEGSSLGVPPSDADRIRRIEPGSGWLGRPGPVHASRLPEKPTESRRDASMPSGAVEYVRLRGKRDHAHRGGRECVRCSTTASCGWALRAAVRAWALRQAYLFRRSPTSPGRSSSRVPALAVASAETHTWSIWHPERVAWTLRALGLAPAGSASGLALVSPAAGPPVAPPERAEPSAMIRGVARRNMLQAEHERGRYAREAHESGEFRPMPRTRRRRRSGLVIGSSGGPPAGAATSL